MFTVGINEFVKRQRKDSQFTHYEGSWTKLSTITQKRFQDGLCRPGYREGVYLVEMSPEDSSSFWTYDDFPMFEGMKLEASFERVPGRENEPPKLQIKILEPKKQCRYVDIVIYHHSALAENNEQSTDEEWEIVSINGRLHKNPAPMDPLTIVRNWKHLPGGTEMKGRTAEEVLEMLCESILYKNGFKKNDNKNK